MNFEMLAHFKLALSMRADYECAAYFFSSFSPITNAKLRPHSFRAYLQVSTGFSWLSIYPKYLVGYTYIKFLLFWQYSTRL